MAVRLIHSNPLQLLQEKIDDLDHEIQKLNIQRNNIERRGGTLPKTFFDAISGLEYMRDEFKNFLDLISDQEEDVPLHVKIAKPEPTTELMREAIKDPDGTTGAKNLFGRRINGTIILYKNAFYAVTGPYDPTEAKLILTNWYEKKRRKIEVLEASKPDNSKSSQRERIAETVRHEVWRRDQGKCVECGSNENLEFDHIIPVSRGGSNTARNLQLLCESCNRRKSDSIA